MKITRLETLLVPPRWLFLKMHTDAGIVGLGEPVVEGRALTVRQAVHELEDYLIGQDPRRIEHHWQAIYRQAFYRGGPILCSALSGIEQAMWDILGKSLGVPVHQLLGGACRDTIRIYSHVGLVSPEEAAGVAREKVELGFNALKTGLGQLPSRPMESPAWIERVVERFAAIRAAVGSGVDVAIDFHGQVGPAVAIRLARALEPYSPLFIEEPCLPENVDALAQVARSTPIPIATGERLFTKWGFREVLRDRAAAILQPDLCHAGGIFECRKIAAMAEAEFALIAPHNPLGPISLAACLQLDACIPNFLVQEQVSLGEGYLNAPFQLDDGAIALPTGPGLGIELDDEAIAALGEHNWQSPRAWYEDGSVADW